MNIDINRTFTELAAVAAIGVGVYLYAKRAPPVDYNDANQVTNAGDEEVPVSVPAAQNAQNKRAVEEMNAIHQYQMAIRGGASDAELRKMAMKLNSKYGTILSHGDMSEFAQ